MSQANSAVLDRIDGDVILRGNTGVVDELLAEDFVEHSPPPGMGSDRQGFKDFVRSLHEAFADLDYTIEDRVVEGDRVAERWTMSATHVGDWWGVASTGRRITFEGMDISRLDRGHVAEHWTQVDALRVLQQLGVIPERFG